MSATHERSRILSLFLLVFVFICPWHANIQFNSLRDKTRPKVQCVRFETSSGNQQYWKDHNNKIIKKYYIPSYILYILFCIIPLCCRRFCCCFSNVSAMRVKGHNTNTAISRWDFPRISSHSLLSAYIKYFILCVMRCYFSQNKYKYISVHTRHSKVWLVQDDPVLLLFHLNDFSLSRGRSFFSTDE